MDNLETGGFRLGMAYPLPLRTGEMRVPRSTALRGRHPARIANDSSPIDTTVTVLYLPSTARDRVAIRDRLSRGGAVVTLAADIPDALRLLTDRCYDLVVVDLAGGEQSVATVRILRAQPSRVPVIAVMDPSDPTTAAAAVSAGASDVMPWPLGDSDVEVALALARDAAAIEIGSDASSGAAEHLYLHSSAMRVAVEALRSANSRKSGLLFVGPSGSGRGLLARSRHALDDDYVIRPFVTVDCDNAGGTELERRLFGGEGRDSESRSSVESVDRTGALVAAQGGSLFLKNLTAAPARVQSRLASVLKRREVFCTDAGEIIPVDVRLIASVQADVEGAVSKGRLSRDLLGWMAAVRIDVPAFRNRREDLPFLALLFLRRACEADRVAPKRFSRAALALMSALPWKGNGPEMADVVSAIVRRTRRSVVQIDDVLEHVSLEANSGDNVGSGRLRDARERFEREHISSALARHQGRFGDAARELGIQRTNLYRKVRQLNVSKMLPASDR
jgi:DNA-binding NtrC family response regulator